MRLEVRRAGDVVGFREVGAGAHAFRRALAAGAPLQRAAEAAPVAEANFDLAGAVRALLDDAVVTGFTLHP